MICKYPGCERKSEFTCVICQGRYCAFHTYESGGYVCKNDFDDYEYIDPHAPKNSADMIGGFFRGNADETTFFDELVRRVSSIFGRRPPDPDN